MARNRGHPSADWHFLVILDMNGVLLVRSASKKSAQLRPHLEHFLAVLWELRDHVAVAVWSSMVRRNLEPLVNFAFGDKAQDLAFVWDQDWCTHCRVKGMNKPLLRKDLSRLHSTPWATYVPDHVLLVDDDPIKCTQNPAGTAVHPPSFTGTTENDSELLRLTAYVQALAHSACGSVRQWVLSRPFDVFQEEAPTADSGGGEPEEEAEEEAGASARPVEAFAEDFDQWFRAQVLEAFQDGSMLVRWEGGDESSDCVLPPGCVREVQEETPDAVQPWRRMESRRQPGVYYYFNESTGESQAEPPEPWELRESTRQAGVFYYWNKETGSTSAEKPELWDQGGP